ncbi:MAG: type II toxin-antitoxin system HicB family antitoxin [Chloroflexi bacterium]|nr:type II toxin-antitoxin system HicB family antitoxin [Chloroflexota bacterium]
MKEIILSVDVIVEPDEPGFHAYCPALKGLHVGGDTMEEALQNARDAVELYIDSFIEHGDPIPIGVSLEQETVSPESKAIHHRENLRLVLAK